jgi:hypothetical protein
MDSLGVGEYGNVLVTTNGNRLDYTNLEAFATTLINSGYVKSFVIDHPKEPATKHLVHVCLEGPEAGVYYRGKGEVTDNASAKISLPDYVPGWAHDFTITVTAIYDGGNVHAYAVSEVNADGKFNVYGENGKFNWIAVGKRGDIVVEPLKTDANVKGFGPYKWIE